MRGIDYKSLYEDLAIRVTAISLKALDVEMEKQLGASSPPSLNALIKLIDTTASITRRDLQEEERLERICRRRPKRFSRE